MKKSFLFCFPLILSAAYLSSCATPKTYSLEVKLEGPNQNSVQVIGTSSGEYKEGYNVNLEVQIAPGSQVVFDGFYVNEELVSSTFTYSFELMSDTTVVVRWSEEKDDPDVDNPNNPDVPDIDEDQIEKNATYQHTWEKGDLDSEGGSTGDINGLSWTYDAITYLGYDDQLGRGVQIGSKNNPQKTPWNISTTIPDGVYVTGYSLDIASVKEGEATYEVKIGDYSKAGDFATKEITTISDENINKTGEEFGLTLTSISGAMYITDFEIYFYVPDGVDFAVSGDNGTIEEPDNPDSPDDPETPGNPPSSDDIPPTKYKPITAGEYYKGIDFNQSSAELFENLSNKISTNITAYSYGEVRYTLLYTDQKVGDPSHLYGLFDGDDLTAEWDFGATWNREHVWPKSKLGVSKVNNGDTNIATDLVNLRASCRYANSSHNNKYYGETTNDNSFFPNITSGLGGSGHKYTGDHRGDVARICFFMALRYDDKISLSDNPSGSYQMGYLSTLLKRNKEDPVDDFEIQRNNRIYEYQGNRNPFVDYGDLADKLF